ncbi:UNVERIFIED_ORG: hypothetical protein GGI66_003599 [Rhizobium esperanzae]
MTFLRSEGSPHHGSAVSDHRSAPGNGAVTQPANTWSGPISRCGVCNEPFGDSLYDCTTEIGGDTRPSVLTLCVNCYEQRFGETRLARVGDWKRFTKQAAEGPYLCEAGRAS